MSQIKPFEFFIKQGIVRKHQPDSSRSQFLQKEAEASYRALQKRVSVLGFDDDSANSIVKDCYDILMELIRAEMLIQGFHASGNGAHEAEVAYFREKGTKEVDVQFLNDMRYFRNGILYYGKILTLEYARTVYEFTTNHYEKLR